MHLNVRELSCPVLPNIFVISRYLQKPRRELTLTRICFALTLQGQNKPGQTVTWTEISTVALWGLSWQMYHYWILHFGDYTREIAMSTSRIQPVKHVASCLSLSRKISHLSDYTVLNNLYEIDGMCSVIVIEKSRRKIVTTSFVYLPWWWLAYTICLKVT